MTIDELLAEAARAAHMAIKNADHGDMLRSEMWSDAAQACAQTAQAMILHGATTDGPSIAVNDANA